ncbi:MAG: Sortase family enzyme [Candidatus Saccharibacteria bacterium]|nr:Sortase family enzyme [Candidatus Saccharibacteria bacterium]
MQDIIPNNRRSRGNIKPVDRQQPIHLHSDRDYRTVYIERSRIINIQTTQSMPPTVVTEQVSITVETPVEAVQEAPVALQSVMSTPSEIQAAMIRELSAEQKVHAMAHALEKVRHELDREQRKKSFLKRLSLSLTAIVLLLSTGYVGINTWLTNNQVKAQSATESAAIASVATGANTSNIDTKAVEGTDKTPLPKNAVTAYQAAPDLPKTLTISKIKVNARVLQMGLNKDNTIQAPINIFDAGWYTGSVKPGEIGAVLIDGHSSADHQALFGNLDKLVVGDQIQLTKGDGTKLTYKVVHTEIDDKDKVNMHSLLLPYGKAVRALNIITCAGDWIPSQDTLTKRVLVYTEQI